MSKQKKKDNDRNTDEYIFFNGIYNNLLSIDIPSYFKKKTAQALNELLSSLKKKVSLSEPKKILEVKFNYKIQNIFYVRLQ